MSCEPTLSPQFYRPGAFQKEVLQAPDRASWPQGRARPPVLRTLTPGHTYRTVLGLLHPDPQELLCKQLQRRPSTLPGEGTAHRALRGSLCRLCWWRGGCRTRPGGGPVTSSPTQGPSVCLHQRRRGPPGLEPAVGRRGGPGREPAPPPLSLRPPWQQVRGQLLPQSQGSRHRDGSRENLLSPTETSERSAQISAFPFNLSRVKK